MKFLVKDYKKKEEIVAKLETLEKVWTSYIPPSAAVAEDVADNAIIVDEEVTTANAEIFDDAVVEVAEIAGGGYECCKRTNCCKRTKHASCCNSH